MIWPFKKKKKHYPNNPAEAIIALYNPILDELFKKYPNWKNIIKDRLPHFNSCNILHNWCAIILIFSLSIHDLRQEIEEIKKEEK